MFWEVSNDYGHPRKITFPMTFQLRSSQIHRHNKGDPRIDHKTAVLVNFSYEKFRLRSVASQMIWVPEDKSDFGVPSRQVEATNVGGPPI
jgi:hypothetical protein